MKDLRSLTDCRKSLRFNQEFLRHLQKTIDPRLLDLSSYDHAIGHKEHEGVDHIVCLELSTPIDYDHMVYPVREYKVPITENEQEALTRPVIAAEYTKRHLLSLKIQGDTSMQSASQYLCIQLVDLIASDK